LRLRVFAIAAKVITHARGIVGRVAKWTLDAADAIAVRGRILALVLRSGARRHLWRR
jgi:hypothetical protein